MGGSLFVQIFKNKTFVYNLFSKGLATVLVFVFVLPLAACEPGSIFVAKKYILYEKQSRLTLQDLDTSKLSKNNGDWDESSTLRDKCLFRLTDIPRGHVIGACLDSKTIWVFVLYRIPRDIPETGYENPRDFLFKEKGEYRSELARIHAEYIESVEEMLRRKKIKFKDDGFSKFTYNEIKRILLKE